MNTLDKLIFARIERILNLNKLSKKMEGEFDREVMIDILKAWDDNDETRDATSKRYLVF